MKLMQCFCSGASLEGDFVSSTSAVLKCVHMLESVPVDGAEDGNPQCKF